MDGPATLSPENARNVANKLKAVKPVTSAARPNPVDILIVASLNPWLYPKYQILAFR